MLERIIEISPAYDKRNSDPNKDYGIGSATMRFVVKGDQGAVQFVIYTAWHLPHVQKELIIGCLSGAKKNSKFLSYGTYAC